MGDILNSAIYEDMAYWVILYPDNLMKLMDRFDLFRKDSIIYCKTDFTPTLFKHLKLSNRKYKLITHHSDYPIDSIRFKSKPDCIEKWYAINVTYDHPNLIGIPLGTKTPSGRGYHEEQYKIDWLKKMIPSFYNKEKITDVVYCNWGDTNSERNKILNQLKIKYHKSSDLSFKDYCTEMSDYKFVISPPGNGIDCHRTWEALYLGNFPIVIKNKIYDQWPDLPIIQVKSYEEVTKELLESYLDKEYNIEKAYSDYWIKEIKK